MELQEVTDTNSNGFARYIKARGRGPERDRLDLAAKVEADRVIVKTGVLEVDLDHLSQGYVKLDGKHVPCLELSLHFKPGELPQIHLSVLAISEMWNNKE